MSLGTFPPELDDLFIQHLKGDVPSLAACGLVNRGWLALSRPLLFGEVVLRDQNSGSFVELLASSKSLTFLPHLHTLSIARPDTDLDSVHAFRNLVPQLAALSRVRNLRLFFVSWVGVSAETFDTFAAVFSNLRNLAAVYTTFGSPADFTALAGRLPHLEEVAVQGAFLTDGDDSAAPHLPPPTTLTVVRMKIYSNDGNPFGHIARWLAAAPPTAFRTLEAGTLWPTALPAAGALLAAVGPNLRQLDFALLNHVTDEEVRTYLPLAAHAPQLADLTLHIGLRRFHAPTPGRTRLHAPWVLLASATNSLQTLTLVLTIDYMYMLDALDWAHLNGELRRLERLQKLYFLVHCHNTVADSEKLVPPNIRGRMDTEVTVRVKIDVEVVLSARMFTRLHN
ncbi:hypothetical protein MIND_01407600 [Mycena indigotica]|uniref:Uncharacterized protein n=1 Tax=Mycena indigotica TaxID=2126181 RepID=A0A8H6VPJ3_9AGAR|nr:uncharacterized protein MIND_01407600 [Mycena indigotica]KAF7288914.1 hypothetical protein MIND_01407600 [Mycena indigotica]